MANRDGRRLAFRIGVAFGLLLFAARGVDVGPGRYALPAVGERVEDVGRLFVALVEPPRTWQAGKDLAVERRRRL